MNDLTKKILKAMGLTDAQIAAMDGDAPTAVETDLTKAVADHQKTLLENDSAFLSPIRDRAKAEVHGIYEKALKKNGLDTAAVDIKDKSPEEKVKALAEMASKGKDKTLDDLNTELMATKTELQNLKDVEIPKIKSEVETEKAAFKISDKITKEILRITEDGKNLRNPIEAVQNMLDVEFKNKYIIELDDKGNPVFKDKATKLAIKNADGTKLLTHEEILKETLGRNKFLAESNADDKDIDPLTGKKRVVVPKPPVDNQEKDVINIPGMSKAEANLAAMKEAAKPKA